LKQKLFDIFYTNKNGWIYQFDNVFITTLIILNCFAVVLESYQELSKYSNIFYAFELFSVIIFTLEYLIRIWVIDLKYPEKSKLSARLKYIFSFNGLIDLLAIIPFYLPLLFNFDGRILRILRLFRLFRILKLSYYNESIATLIVVFKKNSKILAVTMFTVITLLVVTSSIMFELEHKVQPEQFPNIPQTLWWSVATLTTIGYGDVYPLTNEGRILASITAE
jgi:voltage-gated potassium channel